MTPSEVAVELRRLAQALDNLAPKPQQQEASVVSIFHGLKQPYGPVPEQFRNNLDPYGARADIGSPGWQNMLRIYAARDGKSDRNAYVKDRGLVPIWPDEKQDWEE